MSTLNLYQNVFQGKGNFRCNPLVFSRSLPEEVDEFISMTEGLQDHLRLVASYLIFLHQVFKSFREYKL